MKKYIASLILPLSLVLTSCDKFDSFIHQLNSKADAVVNDWEYSEHADKINNVKIFSAKKEYVDEEFPNALMRVS